MKTKLWLGMIAVAAAPILAICQDKKPEPPADAAVVVEDEVKPVSDFVRYVKGKKSGESDVLQTAIARYKRKSDGMIVDLVSVVHIGDRDYYDRLNVLLEDYDAVLYELVGGEFEKRGDGPVAKENLAAVHQAQTMAQRFLDLDHQLDAINYGVGNFVHADADWDQFYELMDAKNQSMATLFQRAMKLSSSGEFESVPTTDAAANRMLIGMLGALASGDSSALKRTIAPFLSEAETLISKIEGKDGTVLVSGRNEIVMEKLSESINAAKKKKSRFAVFYGAGHMPDLEDRLLAEKFEKGNVSWLTAWDMPQPKKGDTPASSQFFQSLIDQDSDALEILKNFGKALSEAQEKSVVKPEAE